MSRQRSTDTKTRGAAALEAGLALIVFVPLVLQGAALFDYSSSMTSLAHELEEILQDTAVRPLRLEERGGQAEVVLNEDALRRYLQGVGDRLESVTARIARNYHLSITVYDVQIDRKRGIALALRPALTEKRGGYQPRTADGLPDKNELPFRPGVPDAGFDAAGGTLTFLPRAALVKATLFIDLSAEVSGRILSLTGGSTMMQLHRTCMLRGDIE